MRRAGYGSIAATLCAALLAGACAAADPADPAQGLLVADGVETRQVGVDDAAAVPDLVEATRRIGVALLATSPADANVVVSPSSVAVALSMLADGARGGTLDELEQVLGTVGPARREAVAALRTALLEHDGDPAVVQDEELPDEPVVHLATQVVVDDQLTPAGAYLRTLAEWYGAGVQHVDLGTSAGKSALDDWVRHHSGGLVERSAIEPGDALRLVLQDAIVLAARWETPFADHATADRPFTLADGTRVQVPTMANAVPAAYAEVDGWRAVRLPYVGRALHADLILPPGGTDPAGADAGLLADLSAALDDATPVLVQVSLPTLDLSPDPLDLTAAIDALGAGAVLGPAADLTGIGTSTDGNPLFLGQAVQQAVLQLDEEGTRAAAVTEFGVEAGAAPQEPEVVLDFDRPFLVQIAHTATSWPLFQAAARDPRT